MAKWGEGDPRWIVEERADATNVNNWHWTERDASKWSKTRLTELFTNIKVQDERGQCEISEIKEITGEATASNRKAKLIFFYEWDIKLEWKGTLKDCTTELKGTVNIPNLSDENDMDDIEISISTKTATAESNTLREVMKSKAEPIMRQKCSEYIQALKQEFSQGMILPSKDKEGNQSSKPSNINSTKTPSPQVKRSTAKEQNGMNTKNLQNLDLGMKIDTSKLEQTEEFKCEASQLYEIFTDNQRVQAFTQASATMDVKVGGKFIMLDGNISGEFVSLEPHSKIVQKWRYKSWPEGHYSVVTLQFNQKSDCTQLALTHRGIPTSDMDRTRHGWNAVFFQRIKSMFGFGASLF